MEGRRLLRSLNLRNVLSFGPEGQALGFEPLNVLIGPNGSGKSNLIEVLSLIRSLPREQDLSDPLRNGGGITEWLWKGEPPPEALVIESDWERPEGNPLRHNLALESDGYKARVVGETISSVEDAISGDVYYGFSRGRVYQGDELFQQGTAETSKVEHTLRTDRSILAQRRATDRFPELAYLRDRFSEIRLYRSWSFGPGSPVRGPSKADLPSDFLLENASNLGLILNGLSLDRRARSSLIENLRELYQGANAIHVRIVSGYVEMLVEEDEGRLIPASRLSDGTLRYLTLLAVLCHPEPPPLVCIEEPELGLHPDIIPTVAELLKDASQRTQLIVTTHSADLVTALGDVPEAVVVCERGLDGTTLRRLDPERLGKWLEKYSLGHLWGMGEIGGNRW